MCRCRTTSSARSSGYGRPRSEMPAANRSLSDPTDRAGIASRPCELSHIGAQRPMLRGDNSFRRTMELPHAHAPDPRCCGRLCGHPRGDAGHSRPRGGVLLPSDIPADRSPRSNSKSGRSPSDNNRWRGSDRGRDEAAEPVKPSTGTRAKRDEEKSSSTSSGKSGKSQAKSEAKSEATSSQASRTRSVRQEPPPSKSNGRASASVRRESPAGGGSTPPATPPAQPSDTSANAAAQSAQFRPRRQHPRRYLRREARRGIQGAD